jgi:endonuclease-3 related protein
VKGQPDFAGIHRLLLQQHGIQHWWPADSAFEVMIGAMLTQNTAWTNVEKALANLKQADVLSLEGLMAIPEQALAQHIRPSGYFNQKAKRLKLFCDWYQSHGEHDGLSTIDTESLRQKLLSVYGIGPETADDILLYAFNRPVFVIDAYTRRIFSRLGMIAGDERYDDLRHRFQNNLDADVPLYNSYHALIVSHGKDICKKTPICQQCILEKECKYSG